MEALSLKEITTAVNGSLINNNLEIDSISIDSRSLEAGDLFIAIQGDNFDGHQFLEDAFIKGAKAAIVASNKELGLEDKPLIRVEDTTKALQDLASYYRQKFSIPVIAVTGSTGKTTTKDMIASILSTKYKTLKTQGNYNNEIGLPLTLFNLDSSHQAVVVEMGMRGLGQIKDLAQIALPDIGVVTNVGVTHIELLKSKDNIARAKAELIDSLPLEGVAILNGDDDYVRAMADSTSGAVINYGLEKYNRIKAEQIELLDNDTISFKLRIGDQKFTDDFIIPIPGRYNVHNALAAIAVALQLDLSIAEIKTGLANLKLTMMRNEILESPRGYKIINDSYNANPTSMRAAIQTLVDLADERKLAVLGDMLELGQLAKVEHQRVGQLVAENKLDYLFTFGKLAGEIAEGAKIYGMKESIVFSFEDKEALIKKLLEISRSNDTILVKGSRGMKLEEVSQALQEG